MMHVLLESESFRQQVTEFVKPISKLVYNEIYLYVWFICIYSIFLMMITLANMFVLLKLWSRTAAAAAVATTGDNVV